MGRIFAFITFLCLLAIIVLGTASPQDPLFIFAAKGPVALGLRAIVAILMFLIAFGPALKLPRLRSAAGLTGFGLITLAVIVLTATQGGGIYPLLQPADLLTAIVVGITLSIVALDADKTSPSIIPDRYFFYQDLQAQSAPRKRLKTSPSHKPA